MTSKQMEVGDFVKVHLPGESPWAICQHIYPDGTFDGKIDNDLVSEATEEQRREIGEKLAPGFIPPKLHDFKCGQVVRFAMDPEYGIWVPKETVLGNA